MKFDKVPLYFGEKQIGWAHDVVVTIDERGPQIGPNQRSRRRIRYMAKETPSAIPMAQPILG